MKNLSLQKDRSGSMKIIFILLLFLLSLCCQAQQSDSQLAYTYYQRKEYDKAAEMFLKLYERTRSVNFLDYHIICLINGKKYKQAKEMLQKYLKTDNRNKDFIINLGYVYEQEGNTKKAGEYYEKAIKTLIPQNGEINSLANKFRNIREQEWAIKTYLRGRELLKKPDAFILELGDCYLSERDYENMMANFIRLLELKPGDINSVTSKLRFARSYDLINNVDLVIEKKLTEIYSRPDYSPVFDELGVWYALQKKDYPTAFRHADLLHRKMEDKLSVFLNIARDAADAGDYSMAVNAYDKMLEKGKEKNNYYVIAYKERLSCLYKDCLHRHAPSADFEAIAREGKNYMQEYGYTSNNIDLLMLLADLYAYRLHQPDTANQLLEKCSRIPRLNAGIQNQLKAKRADLLIFMDNLWEATILYTQIEKANPNHDTGYEAKLKKAWLAYYAGDLLWAKAQFDVLKGATSKLIANDALQMAHFIQLNYDEEHRPDMEKLARTEYLIYRQQDRQALPVLDSLIANSSPGIADYAALQKALLLTHRQQYDQACQILEKLKNESTQTYIRAEALFKLAGIKTEMQAIPQAQELYKQLVSEYSGSVYSVEAGKLYRENQHP